MQLTAAATREGEEESARAAAVELARMLRRLFLDARADHLGVIDEHNLTATQVRALYLLGCAAEPMSAGELADRLGLSPAAISRSLDTLVRRRLATRRESTADRRVRLVELTGRGRRIVDELVALRLAGLESFVAELSPGQRDRLAEVLADINATAASSSRPEGDR